MSETLSISPQMEDPQNVEPDTSFSTGRSGNSDHFIESGDISPPAPAFAFMMLQMIGMLIFLSILLYLALYFFKKLNAKFKNQSQAVSFRIHENVYLSSKQGLSAVSFGKKLYIVGFSPNSVNLIDVIEDEEIISKFGEKNNTNHTNFSEMFKVFFKK